MSCWLFPSHLLWFWLSRAGILVYSDMQQISSIQSDLTQLRKHFNINHLSLSQYQSTTVRTKDFVGMPLNYALIYMSLIWSTTVPSLLKGRKLTQLCAFLQVVVFTQLRCLNSQNSFRRKPRMNMTRGDPINKSDLPRCICLPGVKIFV